ncbi:NADH dehydrogenase subunit N [Novosphingobium nitrogenifigens DSM 19370]|uniref:NADH-quinone oxidoreductase subunit N n=1 Tax=Novosphingobium nitrogenifigens DSM 19370 TaxID=983920 RepID=F1Z968_9SPHN|nr:NADH-quinone oxidoreductase subunit NuoN [Novosphingobium nitrogenifigens]EGD58912.1 NADH dehydrogenase subunit N [Novosphingobium nitrogenifigens DSM 19370]
MDFAHSLAAISAEELISGAGLVLLLVAAWGGDKAARAISVAALVVLVAAAALAVPALAGGVGGKAAFVFDGQLRVDAFASFAKLLIYLGAGVTLIVAPSFFERFNALRAEFPLLVLFAALGMGIMVSAGDLLTLYIGLELNSLASYVLAAMLRSDGRSAEAGLKYFVLGSLASGILLYGVSLTYGFTGTTSFEGIRTALSAGPLSIGATFGMVFVFAGLAFKISAAPFHMWTPDVYEGSPTPVTTFFATAPKAAALALLMRVSLDAFGAHVSAWNQIVIFASLFSIIIGALGAITQNNIKRLLAYSSINNVGFMLIGLAAGTPAGASAMLVYLAIYVVTSVAGFAAVLLLRDENGDPIEAISDMAGLSRTRPGLAAALAIVMFSLAGIPPLFGFWGKFVVFQAAVQAHLVLLAAVGIAASVIGAFYYLKVVKVLYFDEPADKVRGNGDFANTVLLALASIAISPLGYLGTKWLGGLAGNAAAALFHVV